MIQQHRSGSSSAQQTTNSARPRFCSCPQCANPVSLRGIELHGGYLDCPQCGRQFRCPVARISGNSAESRTPVPSSKAPVTRRISPSQPNGSPFKDSARVPAERPSEGSSWWLLLGGIVLLGGGTVAGVLAAPVVADLTGSSAPPAAVSAAGDGSGEDPSATAASAESNADAELAREVVRILEHHCHECHGAGGSDEGGFNYVLNLKQLTATDGLVVAGQPDSSRLIERIVKGEMPPDGPAVPESEIAILKRWVAAGAPVNPSRRRTFVSNEQQLGLIRKDLFETLQSTQDRLNARYFTLTHLANANLSEDELETYRVGLAKLVNSLSWSSTLAELQAIDPDRTIFRLDLRDVDWKPATWDRILKVDPYKLLPATTTAQLCVEATACTNPLIRGDWFVAKASVPPLYHDLLELPQTLAELEKLLRVDVSENIQQERALRAGFAKSGVSENNRIIERHQSVHGMFWISYDFASSAGRKNIFAHPLGPDADSTEAFQPDGGEIIFELPNGMHAYMLIDGAGQRIDEGPIDIVADNRQPNRHVINGVSCMSCHYGGIIRKQDEIRPAVLANQPAYQELAHTLALYAEPARLQGLMEQDSTRFQEQLSKLGVTRITETGEPIRNLRERFLRELDLELAAAELGLTAEELLTKLKLKPQVARSLSALLVPGGVIKRDQFLQAFSTVAKGLELGVEAGLASAPAAPAAENEPATLAPAATNSAAASAETREVASQPPTTTPATANSSTTVPDDLPAGNPPATTGLPAAGKADPAVATNAPPATPRPALPARRNSRGTPQGYGEYYPAFPPVPGPGIIIVSEEPFPGEYPY